MKSLLNLSIIFLIFFSCESNSSNKESYLISEDQINFPQFSNSDSHDNLRNYVSDDDANRSLHLHYFNLPSPINGFYPDPFVSVKLNYIHTTADSTYDLVFTNPKLAELELKKLSIPQISNSSLNISTLNYYYWGMIGLDSDTGLPYKREFPSSLSSGKTPNFTAIVDSKQVSKDLAPLMDIELQITKPSLNDEVNLDADLEIEFSSILSRGTRLELVAYNNSLSLLNIPAALRKYMIMEFELPTNTSSISVPRSVMSKLSEIKSIFNDAGAEFELEIFVQSPAEKHDEINLNLNSDNKALNVFVTKATYRQIKTK